MNTFLCLRTNKVIDERELRATRSHQMMLSRDIENWSDKVYAVGEMRRIHNVKKPAGPHWRLGYEERDGKLYQTWTKKQ